MMDMAEFNKRLVPFSKTYGEVTKRLSDYRTHNPDSLAPYELDWFGGLITDFQNEFDKWKNTNHPLRKHLEAYLGTNKRAFWLIGSVYLHVAFDLPRVIADKMPDVFKGKYPDCLRRARGIYLKQAPVFLEVFRQFASDTEVVGKLAWLTWPMPKGVLEVVGHWVLALRTSAWIHGETFYQAEQGENAHLNQRKELEEALSEAVKQAFEEKKWWPHAPGGLGLLLAAVPQAPRWGSWPAWTIAGGLILVALLAVISILFIRGRRLKRFADEFGRTLYQYTNEAVSFGQREFGERRHGQQRLQG